MADVQIEQPEQSTCRICRGEGTSEEPLYHPCRCSGSIKFVHQDCLDEWLRHSKKQATCELCNTPYRFTKVYSTSMPTQVPIFIFLQKLSQDIGSLGKFALRCVLVFVLWIITLPLLAAYASYLYTGFAESIPYDPGRLLHPKGMLVKSFTEPQAPLLISLPGFIDRKIESTLFKRLLMDVCTGQVIIMFILLIGFVVMVVREWVLQTEVFIQQLQDMHATNLRLHAELMQNDRRLARRTEENLGPALARLEELNLRQAAAPANEENIEVQWNQNARPEINHEQPRQLPDWANDLVIRQEEEGEDPIVRLFQQGADQLRDLAMVAEGNQAVHGQDARNDRRAGNRDQNAALALEALMRQRVQEQQPFPPPPPPPQPAFDLDNDLDDGNIDENMDMDGGFLELMGVRGPLIDLLTGFEAAVRVVVLVLGFLYCIPYMLGRVVALLAFPIVAFHSMIAFVVDDLLYNGYKYASKFFEINLDRLHKEAVLRYAKGITIPSLDIPGSTFWDRLGWTLLGHGVLLLTIAIYTRSNYRFARSHESFRIELNVLQYFAQALAILKVITVFGIELVVFPVVTGLLLVHIALGPLYPVATLQDRIVFTLGHPITSTFTHWAVGTCYMSLFALFVALCRKIMRNGAMYFLRDPSDPNFHPIRDVLERSLTNQLGKIGLSAVIYSILIVVCIGGVVAGLRYGLKVDFLPLHLMPELKGDRVFNFFTIAPMIASYNLLLPILVKIIRSLNIMRKIWDAVFKYSCSWLRLSSFILNHPAPQEQGYIYYGSLWARLRCAAPDYTHPVTLEAARSSDPDAAYFIHDGYWVRAPRTDSLASKIPLKLFIPVTKDDVRLDNQEDDKEHELSEYAVVYRPPLFRVRVGILLLIFWVAGTAVIFTVSALPLIVGKSLVHLFLAPEAHLGDLIYYLVGIVPVAILTYAVDNWYRLYTFITEEILQLHNVQTKKLLSSVTSAVGIVSKMAFLIVTVLVMIPFMVGTLVYLYVAIPATAYLGASLEMTITSNLLYGLTGMLWFNFVLARFPDSGPARTYRAMTQNGWRDYDIKIAFWSVLLPVTGLTIVGVCLPWSMGYILEHTVYVEAPDTVKRTLYQFSYPVVLGVLTMYFLVSAAFSAWRQWEVSVRDQAYMVGRQLQNM